MLCSHAAPARRPNAPTRASVNAFHAAGLAHGGRDHCAPGLRPQYGADYYAGYVLDLDGHVIEAVCRRGSRQPQRNAPADPRELS